MEAGGALHRKERGGSQTFLDKSHRRANVVRAFSCHFPSVVAGRNVLLVDDVLTSGATADGCVRASLWPGGSEGICVDFRSVSSGRERLAQGGFEGSSLKGGSCADCL